MKKIGGNLKQYEKLVIYKNEFLRMNRNNSIKKGIRIVRREESCWLNCWS